VNMPSRCTFGIASMSTLEAYIVTPNMANTAISRMLRPPLRGLADKAVAAAVGHGRGVNARDGVTAVNVERPVVAVGVVVGDYAVDGLDEQAELALLAFEQAVFLQRVAQELGVGADG